MSKKHAQAEKKGEVQFGDLLKIQQSLISAEKKFESSAGSLVTSMLTVQHMRRFVAFTVLVNRKLKREKRFLGAGNLLKLTGWLLLLFFFLFHEKKDDFRSCFDSAASEFGKLGEKHSSYLTAYLPKAEEEWNSEVSKKEKIASD